MKNESFISSYINEMISIIPKINREKIDQIIEILFDAWQKENTIYLIGNGGSAANASHLVNDLGKCTAIEGKKRMRVIGLTDNNSLITALVNDNGFDNLYSEQLKNLMRKGDVLIAFSVHGGSGCDKVGIWSQNILKAVKLAKDNGLKTIGFIGFDGGALKDLADISLIIPFESTQHVESFHLAIGHLICNCLKEKIKQA